MISLLKKLQLWRVKVNKKENLLKTTAKEANILGLDTDNIENLDIKEVLNNEPALKMLLHHYKQLNSENNELKTQVNTNQSYVFGYNNLKKNSQFGAALLLLGNIFIAFGVNLLTQNSVTYGLFVFIPGLLMGAVGLYFSLKNEL